MQATPSPTDSHTVQERDFTFLRPKGGIWARCQIRHREGGRREGGAGQTGMAALGREDDQLPTSPPQQSTPGQTWRGETSPEVLSTELQPRALPEISAPPPELTWFPGSRTAFCLR